MKRFLVVILASLALFALVGNVFGKEKRPNNISKKDWKIIQGQAWWFETTVIKYLPPDEKVMVDNQEMTYKEAGKLGTQKKARWMIARLALNAERNNENDWRNSPWAREFANRWEMAQNRSADIRSTIMLLGKPDAFNMIEDQRNLSQNCRDKNNRTGAKITVMRYNEITLLFESLGVGPAKITAESDRDRMQLEKYYNIPYLLPE